VVCLGGALVPLPFAFWARCAGGYPLGCCRHSGILIAGGRGGASKKVAMVASTSAALRPTSIRAPCVWSLFQDKQIISPLSSISTCCLRIVKYTSVLLALHWGVRCRCALISEWHVFIATYRARRSRGVVASRTRRGSWMAGNTRENFRKSTGRCSSPSSEASCVCHDGWVSLQPRLRAGRPILLT
jgi:hypothetical protein